jgi:Leucine-rich repeat (LRR) protein
MQRQQQQQQQRGLRLVSFTGDLPGMPGMLAALPAHSLTQLELDLSFSRVLSGPGLAAALARLSNLQQLSLSTAVIDGIPASCLSGVAQLNHLTSLSLAGHWSGGQQPLQQCLAQLPPLRQLRLKLSMLPPKLDLAHCSELQELTFATDDSLPEGTTLPLQLQRLNLSTAGSGDELAGLQLHRLQELQHLSLRVPMTARSLQDLTQLPALQHVALSYCTAAAAEQTAGVWQQLPQLHELDVQYYDDMDDMPDKRQMLAILGGIKACDSLTKLELEVRAVRIEQQQEEDSDDDFPDFLHEPVNTCSLSSLTNLQDLRIVESSQLTAGDALSLTALTRLTRLELGGLDKGVGELAANAIACCLKELRYLDLQHCGLGSTCLAAIAHLPKLTELKIEHNSGLTRQGLMQLTRLSTLQKLGTDAECMPYIERDFWAALGQQPPA